MAVSIASMGYGGGLMPQRIARLMGWAPDLLGTHQIRSLWMAMAAMGAIICLGALRMADLVPLTLAIILLTLGYLSGRLMGLVFDGAGPRQTYFEIGLEVVIVMIGVVLIKRAGV